jgi:hypothetical protein
VVKELISGFVEGRDGLLASARRSAEVEGGKQEEEEEEDDDDDESPRPKKRRKVHAPRSQQDGAGAERRSTRSQSRRDAMQASQEIAEEHIVDDAGSEYEE